jgi:hypothetical protein
MAGVSAAQKKLNEETAARILDESGVDVSAAVPVAIRKQLARKFWETRPEACWETAQRRIERAIRRKRHRLSVGEIDDKSAGFTAVRKLRQQLESQTAWQPYVEVIMSAVSAGIIDPRARPGDIMQFGRDFGLLVHALSNKD